MRKIFLTSILFFSISFLISQKLINGPMLGYLSFREAAIWVQTSSQANVKLVYWQINNPKQKYSSQSVTTQYAHAYCATLKAELLDLGKEYAYQIYINNKAVPSFENQTFKTHELWKWRNDAPDFSFLTGSCNYVNDTQYDRPGKPYGSEHHIFESMARESASFMVWLGDNIYLREPDWDSKSGIDYRYTHARSLPEGQKLWRKMHHYAIWDDHDFGPNDSQRSYYLKNLTTDAFKYFWPNPNFGVANGQGITGFFQWSDCDFYLMDDRYFRTPVGAKGEILGKDQLTWLIESIKNSTSKFKFVCIGTQVLNSAKTYENHVGYEDEWRTMIDLIDQNQLKNIIFLTGDRHNSEISKITTINGVDLYDFTVSPLTSGSTANLKEINQNRIEGSYIGGKRNYAEIKVSGGNKSRHVNILYKDVDGNLLNEYKVSFQE